MAPAEESGPLAAARFRHAREALARGLVGLHGRAAPVPEERAERAAGLAREWRASRAEAARHDWSMIARAWQAEEGAAMVDALHRLARNLGGRQVWALFAGAPEAGAAQAVALDSDVALDNPLGLAALAAEGGGPAELALLDPEVAAGLRLARGPSADVAWELEVWGEPWLSAATRALRGVG